MQTGTKNSYNLSLAPLLYPLNALALKKFYQEAALINEIKKVYLGEIVCAKRALLIKKYQAELIETLLTQNKEVVISTPILHNDQESHQLMLDNIDLAKKYNLAIEINDLAALKHIDAQAFSLGPYINVYNQETANLFARKGADYICPPFEAPKTVLQDLAQSQLPLEVTIFGHLPLSISSRCFSSRAHNVHRKDCQLACLKDESLFKIKSQQTELFLINGMQIQTAKIYNLLKELPELLSLKINSFRINPVTEFSLQEIAKQINNFSSELPDLNFISLYQNQFANGFYYGLEGYTYS